MMAHADLAPDQKDSITKNAAAYGGPFISALYLVYFSHFQTQK
jgi:hypothetical protein